MRKGISPLVASVLLIAITIAIAAILANWVSTYTEEALPTTSCIGGDIAVISAEYPKWTASNTILAVVEAKHVKLSDFKIVVLLDDDSVKTYDDKTGLSLDAGTIGTIETENLDSGYNDTIKSVYILTSCADIKSSLYSLK